MLAIHTMVNVRLHKDAAHRTVNVVRMRNVCNLGSVFVHRHSSWIQVTEANVKTHANDMLAELTRNVLPLIHHSVCARLDSKETHCKAVSMKMVCS